MLNQNNIIMQFMFFIIMLISMLFMNFSHPLTLGLILLIQTLLTSMFIGMISQSFWFSYILFLVFIGGMLILFMYIISLIFNKKFNFNINIFTMMISMMMLIIILYYLTMKYNNLMMMNNNDLMKMIKIKTLILENSLNMNKFFNFPNFIISLLTINYLLFMLNVVMKITNFQVGPLRNKIN